MSNTRTKRGRRLLSDFALLVFSTLVFLLLAEAAVRVIAPQRPVERAGSLPRGFYAANARLGFTMNPSFHGRFRQRDFDTEVRFNSIGIRDREFGPKPAGVKRLLVLGDSYTFGWGVNEGERFADRLEQRLAELPGDRWEVVKAGTNAYSTARELAWLREYGWALQPDLVLLQFCMGNDFGDNVGPDYRVENGELVAATANLEADGSAGPGGLKAWARRHSHLYIFLRNFIKHPNVGRRERRRAELQTFNEQVTGGASRTREILAEMASDARAHGVPLVIAVVPMRHQVYGFRRVDFDLLDYPNRVINAAARADGLHAIDLLPAFRRRAIEGSPRLYFRHDAHWTREGHRFAGDALFDSLRAGGWLGR